MLRGRRGGRVEFDWFYNGGIVRLCFSMYFCLAVAIMILFLSWNVIILWDADFENVDGGGFIPPVILLWRMLSRVASTEPVLWSVAIINSGEIVWGASFLWTSRVMVAKLGGRKYNLLRYSALSEALSLVAFSPKDWAISDCMFCFQAPSSSAVWGGKNLFVKLVQVLVIANRNLVFIEELL